MVSLDGDIIMHGAVGVWVMVMEGSYQLIIGAMKNLENLNTGMRFRIISKNADNGIHMYFDKAIIRNVP